MNMEKFVNIFKCAYSEEFFDNILEVLEIDESKKIYGAVGHKVIQDVIEDIMHSTKRTTGALRQEILSSVQQSVWESGYGNHDAGWLSFYDYFAEELNLKEETKPVSGLIELAKHAGWWIPHENVCWVSEKPVAIHRDEKGRLHSTTEMAISYADGWGLYAIKGLRVPSYLVTNPEEITPQKIDEEENVEIRRIMLEIFGFKEYLAASDAKLIHEDKYGKLYHKELPDDETLAMVKVIDATPQPDGTYKEYFLQVSAEHTTAHAAVASTWDKTADEYNPDVET